MHGLVYTNVRLQPHPSFIGSSAGGLGGGGIPRRILPCRTRCVRSSPRIAARVSRSPEPQEQLMNPVSQEQTPAQVRINEQLPVP